MVVGRKTDPHRKYKELEELTGISATSWRDVCIGKKRPSGEHLSALATAWPEYSLWLLTGNTNVKGGQTSPEIEQLEELQKTVGKR
jgi:hypothetical protein